MSYSLRVKAATKAAALAELGAKFDSDVLAHQPTHSIDKDQALKAAEAFVGLLADDDTKDVEIAMNGSLSWSNAADAQVVTHASVGVSCYYVIRHEVKA